MEIIEHMPYEDYAKRAGTNPSLLKIVHAESLKDAKAYLDGGGKESPAMDFGTCFHSLALENREDWATHPATYAAPKTHEKVKKGEIKEGDPLPWNFAAGICKDWAKENAKGQIILNESETAHVKAMVAVAREELGEMLEGRAEVSMFGEREGYPMKCRADLLSSRPPFPIIDFKSTKSANPQKFLRDAIDKGYHLQGAVNLDLARQCGEKRTEFWLFGIASKPPHATCLLKFKDEPLTLLRVGRAAYRAAFQKLITAQETNQWPGYGRFDAEEFAPIWLREEIDKTA